MAVISLPAVPPASGLVDLGIVELILIPAIARAGQQRDSANYRKSQLFHGLPDPQVGRFVTNPYQHSGRPRQWVFLRF